MVVFLDLPHSLVSKIAVLLWSYFLYFSYAFFISFPQQSGTVNT